MRILTAVVAPSTPGSAHHNTLVLSGIDVVIPLEADLNMDPESDDSVRLRSYEGTYEAALKMSDPEVTQDGDNPLFLYKFQDVVPGTYVVQVNIGDNSYQVMGGLHISRAGAFINGKSFEEPSDGSPLGTPENDLVIEDEEPNEQDMCCPE